MSDAVNFNLSEGAPSGGDAAHRERGNHMTVESTANALTRIGARFAPGTKARRGLRALAGVVSVGAVVALAACSGGGAPSPGAGGDDAESGVAGKRVVMVHCGDINPWCAVYNETVIEGL